ncbi:MAG: histidine phosphatase family protein [Eubacteriales bacterium]|nr:histidine phosphatase family protein [Eubacteriales bacterium]
MKIWITRHGQTNLNLQKRMQGLSDMPLNATGEQQAAAVREKIGEVRFDAVYASPLIRARKTASIISGVPDEKIIKDKRIIEADFGRYEKRNYYLLGPRMFLYWLWPEVIPAPKTVETTASMRKRTTSFLQELEKKQYENVLIVCHGGIMRVLSGYLEDRPNGLKWRPKPKNCEVRVYESENGQHKTLASYK